MQQLQVSWHFKWTSNQRAAYFQADAAPVDTSAGAKSTELCGTNSESSIIQQQDDISQNLGDLQNQIRPTDRPSTHHFVNPKAAFPNHACVDDNCKQDYPYPTRKTTATKARNLGEIWGSVKGQSYDGDILPPGLDQQQHERFMKNYRGILEKPYCKTKLSIITPDNAGSFLTHIFDNNIKSVDMQGHFSGSSTFTLWAYRSGFSTLRISDRYALRLEHELEDSPGHHWRVSEGSTRANQGIRS